MYEVYVLSYACVRTITHIQYNIRIVIRLHNIFFALCKRCASVYLFGTDEDINKSHTHEYTFVNRIYAAERMARGFKNKMSSRINWFK